MKHLISIFGQLNELERTTHFMDRTSDQGSSRFVEYDPVSSKHGWQIQSMEEVDGSGKPTGAKSMSLEKFTRETGFSEATIKKAVSLAFAEMVNQKWIDDLNPEDRKGYHAVRLGKIAFMIGTSLYSPVYFIPSNERAGDTAWLIVRDGKKITTVKFFPWNVDAETLAKDALASVNNDRYKAFKNDLETARLMMIPFPEKAKALSYDVFKSNFSVIEPAEVKTFFRITLSKTTSEKALINAVKRAFGAEITSDLVRTARAEGVERERADHGTYFNLDLGTVFWYFNQDPNNKNLEPEKYNPLEILKPIKPGSSRTREVEVRHKKTGRTFILKINPGDILRISRTVKGGGNVYHKFEVTPTDNTPQNVKRISVRRLDLEQE